MIDAECPYCGIGIEINHDDGYGCDVSGIYEQECGECEKVFVYTTSIHFYHSVHKAPCLNGEEHNWQEIIGFPKGYYSNYHRCEWCDAQELKDRSLMYNPDKDSWKK